MSKQLAMVVASRLNMQPALISPAYADMVIDSLRQLAHADDEREEADQVTARANMMAAYGYSPDAAANKPFLYSDGVAFIPVTGLLINRYSSSMGWVTGYNFIRAWLNAAIEDADVNAIVLDCNSGGGEVAGCFELAADIRAARDQKPILAVVDASAYSACYAIASSASKIIVTPSGGVGSVGVVAMHFDFSKMLSDSGIKVTMIYSGDHKVEGNPYEPLPEPVRASIQARVDATRQQFVALVASNRGLDEKVVYDTQAACFTVGEALDRGLIDAVAAPQMAVSAFLSELSGSKTSKEITMATAEKTPGAESEAATPDSAKQVASAPTVDKAAERAAERDRIKAITTNDAAKDKAGLANHLALNTELSVDEAVAILAAASPEKQEAAQSQASAFERAMDTTPNPEVGADSETASTELSDAQRILQNQALATGVKLH